VIFEAIRLIRRKLIRDVMLLKSIMEVTGANLDRDIGCLEDFRDFLQYIKAHARMVL
jgi:hypothetical protein